MDGLCLRTECEFFGVNTKPYKILEALSKYSNLSDEYIADKLSMNIRTYQRHKAYLVMVGALQVRQLNASTYMYVLGENAIAKDDCIHSDSDYKKIVSKVVDSYSLIDDDKSSKNKYINNSFNVPTLLLEEHNGISGIYDKYPMPSTDEIIECM